MTSMEKIVHHRKKSINSNRKNQQGQSIVEYLIVLSSLLIASLVVGSLVELLAQYNANQSEALRAVF